MRTDIEINQNTVLKPISEIAARLGIAADSVENFGRYKAKISLDFIDRLKDKPDGKLILVTAMSPTPAGEGKTTTTVGLGDALNKIGKNAIICLREPSVGPLFGMKGGATGGGYAQVAPMEDINLHFTGDFSAIALAHNLLAALIDNHIHHGNSLLFDLRHIPWKRVIDMNDRALRMIMVGLGGSANGFPRADGFDIVVASEVMAILCFARTLTDLKERLGNIVVGYRSDSSVIRARDLKAHGAMTVVLKEALKPNLVQTLENNPVLIHGGPFANIAHGCNSVIATATALKLADYVVTEAGFGADLGAEKFVDIKCRKSGLRPSAVVVVATIRALKYHGGCDLNHINVENIEALEKGIANLQRHVNNVRDHYGLPCVVSVNHFTADTPAEQAVVAKAMAALDAPVMLSRCWAEGGAGATDVARKVVEIVDGRSSSFRYVYEDSETLWDKIKAVATKIYGAEDITADANVRKQIDAFQAYGYGDYPVCIAKTQYSFSTDPNARGAPSGHRVNIREVRLAAGAEFIVVMCGDVMTMPGLPKVPASENIDISAEGQVVGLF